MSILKYKNPTTGEWEKVGAPTSDASEQIAEHNTDTAAHADIRMAISKAAAAASEAQATADSKATMEQVNSAIEAIPAPDVSGQISVHNTDTAAHADIRQAMNSKAPMYDYGTEDLTAGVSPLESGKLYFIYA